VSERVRTAASFLLIYIGLIATHFWLLRLPYFWDEAGYYIPAAFDFFQDGRLIPASTLTNAHPPLPSIYLAIWWKVFGFSPLVTRLAMLSVAAFALWQVYLIARRVANREVAMAAAILSAAYPVFFAQSSLAHADVPAMALTLWGLRLYLEDKFWQCATAFSLAALAKETAIFTPLVLFAWEVTSTVWRKDKPQWRHAFWTIVPVLPLAGWYAYHFTKTGFVFGNPEFVKYNVGTTLSPLRFVLALAQRSWQVFGHMNMWVLTAGTGAAMLLPAINDAQVLRKRIALSTQLVFAAVVLAQIVAYSVIGGALLSRYLLPVFPLVIIIGVSTLWRRVKEWRWVVGFVFATFVVGWFVNPPYRFAPEDNLNYADYVRLHQEAINFLEGRSGIETVLTAWTASDELGKPYLGYVPKPPVRVVRIEDFSFDQIFTAQRIPIYDAALVFSTKYEPTGWAIRWKWWEQQNEKYFQYHHDLPPEVIARMLGGTVVMQEWKNGQWVAVIEMPRSRNAGKASFTLHGCTLHASSC
jgi:4-amino-4-deoxy-L-arabinose transferase-like glycosyltransferase